VALNRHPVGGQLSSSPTLCGDCWSRRLAQSAAVDVSGGVSSIGRLRVRCPYFCPAGGQRQCAL